MKSIITLCAAVILGCGASMAQYMCRQQGTVLTYTEAATVEKETISEDFTATVISVETDDMGLLINRIEEVHKVPGNALAEVKNYNGFTFNPATSLTTYDMMSGDDFKAQLLDMIKMSAEAAGQFVSDSDMAELKKSVRVSGDLSLPLPGDPDLLSQKVANQSIKVNIATQSMSMNLWEVKYLGYEDVEVPAGKFEQCLKVSYVIRQTSPEGNEKQYVTEWYAKEVGVVKSVNADKKGNVVAEQVLKSIQK